MPLLFLDALASPEKACSAGGHFRVMLAVTINTKAMDATTRCTHRGCLHSQLIARSKAPITNNFDPSVHLFQLADNSSASMPSANSRSRCALPPIRHLFAPRSRVTALPLPLYFLHSYTCYSSLEHRHLDILLLRKLNRFHIPGIHMTNHAHPWIVR